MYLTPKPLQIFLSLIMLWEHSTKVLFFSQPLYYVIHSAKEYVILYINIIVY